MGIERHGVDCETEVIVTTVGVVDYSKLFESLIL